MATLSQRILKDKIDTRTRELKTARKNVGNNPQRKAHVKKLEKQLATLVSKRTKMIQKTKPKMDATGPADRNFETRTGSQKTSVTTTKGRRSIASRRNSLGPLSEEDRRNKIIGSVQGGDEPVETPGTGLRDKAAKKAAQKIPYTLEGIGRARKPKEKATTEKSRNGRFGTDKSRKLTAAEERARARQKAGKYVIYGGDEPVQDVGTGLRDKAAKQAKAAADKAAKEKAAKLAAKQAKAAADKAAKKAAKEKAARAAEKRRASEFSSAAGSIPYTLEGIGRARKPKKNQKDPSMMFDAAAYERKKQKMDAAGPDDRTSKPSVTVKRKRKAAITADMPRGERSWRSKREEQESAGGRSGKSRTDRPYMTLGEYFGNLEGRKRTVQTPFGNVEIDSTSEAFDYDTDGHKHGGKVGKGKKKAKGRKRAALRGHRAELRGG